MEEICALVWATEEPLLFLTVDARTKRIMNRPLKKKEPTPELKKEMEYKPNFREKVAVKKPYKGTRKKDKPYHYDNLTAYILGQYECVTAEGLEADDLLAIYQTKALRDNPDPTTIICTRDKDLRMVRGMHFGWACGSQSAFGPEYVDEVGRLNPIIKNDKVVELKGTGMSFFCAQLIVGDTVDNIPGLPRKGPVKALDILSGADTYPDMLKAVRDAYKAVYEDDWDKELLEQARLLWMVCDLDEDGKPVMFELPEWLYEDRPDEENNAGVQGE